MAKQLKRDFIQPPEQPGQHVYEGITFPGLVPASTLDAMKTWQVRQDDIFCVTYPKSGTHWMFEIVSLIINGGDPSKIERSHMVIGAEMSISDMLPTAMTTEQGAPTGFATIDQVAPPGYTVMDDWKSPRVILTHLDQRVFPPDALKKKNKVIYVARNPKDVFCSTASFAMPLLPPELKDFDNLIKNMLLSDKIAFGTWFEHVQGWSKKRGDNILFVKYEDLQKDLLGEVKKIATFLGRPLTDDVAEKVALYSTMDQMRKTYDKHEKDDPQGKMHTRAFGQLKFLNKGKVGNWKDKITGDLNELFNEVYQEKMAGSGLQFDFEI